MTPLLVCAAFSLLSLAPPPRAETNRPAAVLRIGASFQTALSDRITVEWQNVPLRELLKTLSGTKKIAILLDRRIDPTQKPMLKLTRVTLLQAIDALAKSVGARVAVVGNFVYIGPPSAAASLIALLKLRVTELNELSQTLPLAHRRQLARRETLHWNDLDSPRDILKTAGKTFGLSLDGLEHVPHDLWAGATLPAVSRTQALSLILIQFDLTFRWKQRAERIEIVPLPVSKPNAGEKPKR